MTTSVTSTQAAWDQAIANLDGHLLQTWNWGSFKAKHGWDVERVALTRPNGRPIAAAQILFRQRGPISVGYIPRGPAFGESSESDLRRLFEEIDHACRKRRALYLLAEADRSLPFKGRYKAAGFVRGPEHVQPARTVKVPLLEDQTLLGQMHQKTRYSVRLAERRGVEIERATPTDETIRDFYHLLSDTSKRNEFGIHDESYYRDFLSIFGDDAVLMFALVEGVRAAGLIAARFGSEAIYMYGASSTEHRAHGAGFRLQFEAMRWARSLGCGTYDLWGIPNEDPATTGESGGERVAGTKGDDWRGLYKFKTGFGGKIVSYPPVLERRYHPVAAFIARRIYGVRH